MPDWKIVVGSVRISGPRRHDRLHHVPAAPVDADGEAAAHRLAEDVQVGSEPEVLGCAAERESEAGDHLVEDEQDASLPGQLAQRPHELRVRLLASDVRERDGLEDDRREVVGGRADDGRDDVDVVPGQHDDVVEHALRESLRRRAPARAAARARPRGQR